MNEGFEQIAASLGLPGILTEAWRSDTEAFNIRRSTRYTDRQERAVHYLWWACTCGVAWQGGPDDPMWDCLSRSKESNSEHTVFGCELDPFPVRPRKPPFPPLGWEKHVDSTRG